MAAYFVIEDDTITNRIIYREGDEYDPGEGAALRRVSSMPDRVDIGWRKVGGEWTAPSTPDPIDPVATT